MGNPCKFGPNVSEAYFVFKKFKIYCSVSDDYMNRITKFQ